MFLLDKGVGRKMGYKFHILAPCVSFHKVLRKYTSFPFYVSVYNHILYFVLIGTVEKGPHVKPDKLGGGLRGSLKSNHIGWSEIKTL